MNLSAFGVLNSQSGFLLAETHDEFIKDGFLDRINVCKKNSNCQNEVVDKTSVVNIEVNGNVNLKRFSNIISTPNPKGDVIGEKIPLEQIWKSNKPLLGINTSMDSKMKNALLPEMSHSNTLDSSNLEDFNELNLCLNSILSYDNDEVITEPLSSNRIIATDNNSNIVPVSPVPNQMTDCNNDLMTRSEGQLHNIFDIVQLHEDIDTDEQMQPHTINIGSDLYIGPRSVLENEEFCATQERRIT